VAADKREKGIPMNWQMLNSAAAIILAILIFIALFPKTGA